MRRRRRKSDMGVEHELTGSQRWLVSYADFITLLFAFFVVMYAISQVNESKYKVLSDALTEAFKDNPVNSTTTGLHADSGGTPMDLGLVPGPNQQSENVIESVAGATQEEISLPKNQPATEQEKREFAQLYQNLNQSLQQLIEAGVVEVRGNEDWIEVDMRSGLLFESGSDVLGVSSEPLLSEISRTIKDNTHLLRIRGYTDDQPIETDRFPSNWELASARAVAVVRSLQRFGVTPQRMAVEGFGEFNPIAGNETEEGRARNRRVVLAISRFNQMPISPKNGTPTLTGVAADVAKRDETATVPAPETTTQSVNSAAPVTNTAGNDNAASGATSATKEPFEIVRLPTGGLLIRGKDQKDNGTTSAPTTTPSTDTPPSEKKQ